MASRKRFFTYPQETGDGGYGQSRDGGRGKKRESPLLRMDSVIFNFHVEKMKCTKGPENRAMIRGRMECDRIKLSSRSASFAFIRILLRRGSGGPRTPVREFGQNLKVIYIRTNKGGKGGGIEWRIKFT